jgi:hypothetical protein
VADRVDELIDEVLVDAYGEDEQLWSFRQVFEDRGRFPFRGQVVGADVQVLAVDYDGDERRGLVAVCRREGKRYEVSLLDVTPLGPLASDTRELVDAYRRWSGAPPLVAAPVAVGVAWQYPRFASSPRGTGVPLALQPMGDWDPDQDYSGDPSEPRHPLLEEVLAAGRRPCFEMEQVIPGVELDDLDDPILEAVDAHGAGYDRDAVRLLKGVLALDERCVDAWGHLGLIAFDTRGAGPAAAFYDKGVTVAEASLPDPFSGVLPWGMVDNRPFLRCLHGLALCAWRQRRWADASSMFQALVWLDPNHSFDALACLEPVLAHQRWSRQ